MNNCVMNVFIEITGQGTQSYPHKSYHEVTPIQEDDGNGTMVTVRYQLPYGNHTYVSLDQATEISAIPQIYALVMVETYPIRIHPDFIFGGLTANEYLAKYVYPNGNTTGMPKHIALEYKRWYETFGINYDY